MKIWLRFAGRSLSSVIALTSKWLNYRRACVLDLWLFTKNSTTHTARMSSFGLHEVFAIW